jgi:O-antigen/teichoic acid export membrane protein
MLAAGALMYNQALTALVGAWLAAKLGPDGYGAVSLARNVFNAMLVLSPLGLDLGLQRYFGESGGGRESASLMFWLRASASCVALVAAALTLATIGWWGASNSWHAEVVGLIALTMLGLPFATDMAVLGGAYRGLRAPSESLLATYIIQPTCRALLVVPMLRAMPGASAAALATALSYAIAWAALASRARDAVPARFGRCGDGARETRRVLTYSVVMGLSTFVFAVARSLDTLALGAWASLGDVGRYAIAQMVGLVVGAVGGALGQTLGARVAAAAADPIQMRDIVVRNMRMASLLSSPFCVAAAVWGSDVDLLIGNAYQTPPLVYAIVAATQWIFAVTHNSSAVLTMTGGHARELVNNLIALVVEAVGCWWLAPRFGIVGAASATLAATVAINAARQVRMRATLGRSALTPGLATPLIVAALVAAPVYALHHAMGFRAWWLTGAACGLEVAGSLALTWWVSPDAREAPRRGRGAGA